LVKLAKPGQETRVDLPALGPRTVQNAVDAGLRGIAVQAGAALIMNRVRAVELADRAGLFLTGIKVPE